jgi:hypothetical protein
MGVDSQSLPPLKSALFVDFDNIYIGLGKNDPAAAERFAADPTRWLTWLEEGLPARTGIHDGPPRRRSILIRRCYPNPDAGFRRYRSFFTSAAFSVIDCPTLTRTGKNSSDIYMVMDILDTLNHKTHFDEFIIFSGDSDFMPVLLRLRAHDRRTTTLAIDFMPPAFKAACDLVINEEDFVEDALGLSQENSGRVKVSMPILKDMAQRVLEVIRQEGEVSGADLPDILKDFREFRESNNWLGYGTSHRLAEALIGQEQRLEIVRVNSIQYKLALKPVHASLSQVHLASVVGKGRLSDARAVGHNPRVELPGRSLPAKPDMEPRGEPFTRQEALVMRVEPAPSIDAPPVEQVPLSRGEFEDRAEPGVRSELATPAEVPARGEPKGRLEPVARAETGESPENDELKRLVVAAVREVVDGSRGPVLLARASQYVVSKLGARVLESQWAGSGSFKKLLQSIGNLDLEITTQPEPGYIYDPARHNHPARRAPRLTNTRPARQEAPQASDGETLRDTNPAEPVEAALRAETLGDPFVIPAETEHELPYMLEPSPDAYLAEMAPELYLEPRTSLQEFARRVSQVTGAPLLTPLQYALVFRGIVTELQQIAEGQKSYSTYQSSKAVSDWCRGEGESIAHTDIALIFKGIIFQDSVRFGKQPGSYTAYELAHVVRDNILSLCQRSRLELNDYERQLLDNWILDGLAVEDGDAQNTAEER